MALRDQPYIPLYVQDYLSDEKLSCCSLSTQGVYIRIMCVLHKSETYGGILFKQIPKQNFSSNEYFAWILAKQTGVEYDDMASALNELLFFEVLKTEKQNEVDFLFQKRMVKDFSTSESRSKAAKKGGGNPHLFKQKPKQEFKQTYKQIDKQNPENEYEYYNNKDNKEGVGEKEEETPKPKRFNFRKALINYGFRDDLVDEWMKVRKAKKSVNTEKSFDDFIREVEKTGEDKDTLLEFIAVKKQWRGFQAKWLAEFSAPNEKLLTYDEVSDLVTDKKKTITFSDFDKKEIDGVMYWIPKKDLK